MSDFDNKRGSFLPELDHTARNHPQGAKAFHLGVHLGGDIADLSLCAWLEVTETEDEGLYLHLEFRATASAGDGLPMGAVGRMSQEGADTVGYPGTEDMFKLAGIGLHMRALDG